MLKTVSGKMSNFSKKVSNLASEQKRKIIEKTSGLSSSIFSRKKNEKGNENGNGNGNGNKILNTTKSNNRVNKDLNSNSNETNNTLVSYGNANVNKIKIKINEPNNQVNKNKVKQPNSSITHSPQVNRSLRKFGTKRPPSNPSITANKFINQVIGIVGYNKEKLNKNSIIKSLNISLNTEVTEMQKQQIRNKIGEQIKKNVNQIVTGQKVRLKNKRNIFIKDS